MTGFFEVYVEGHFSAAHALVDYPGDCARLHGHNWVVRVFVKCGAVDDTGIGIDFREVRQALDASLADFDHTMLNNLPVFKDRNATAENIARLLYGELGRRLNKDGVKVSGVMVAETPAAGVYYREE